MKVFSQLVSAQFENRTSDYAAGTGKFWIRTDTSPVVSRFYDGSAVRTIVTTDNVQTLTNKVLSDSTTTVADESDPTKIAKFQCSGITGGQTRTFTFRDETGTLVSMATPSSAKGDLITHTGTTFANQTVGTDGHVLTADSAQTNGIKWAAAPSAPTSSNQLTNLAITATVATSALTIAVKTQDGGDAGAGDPIKVGFRNATAATGDYSQLSLESSLSLVITNGSTLGHTSAVAQFIYVYLINNAGTILLGASSKLFDEGSVQSTTAEGGLGTADSATVLYSSSSVSGKAIRLIGRLTSTQATAGNWSTSISEISLAPFDTRKLTQWVSYTPTLSNTTNTTDNGAVWRRVGDTMEVVGNVQWTGAGGGSTFTASLPSGYTIDVSKLPNSGGSNDDDFQNLGPCDWWDASASARMGAVHFSSTSVVRFTIQAGAGSIAGTDFAANDGLKYRFSVPIVGWDA